MDFATVVKRRRMCRSYSDRDVPQEKLDRILDLACRYPSAGHTEHVREVQEVLGLPPDVRPIGLVPVGYCVEGPRRLARRSRARIVHHDRYGSR
jgi:nitroreductase